MASSGGGSRHLQQQQPFTITKRGGAFITTHSGCRISKWIYDDVESHSSFECNPNDIRQLTSNTMHLIDDYDTIYIPFSKLVVFGDKVLDHLAVKVVIISGLWQNGGPNKNETIQRMLNNSNVVSWFCQNLPKYGGNDPYHKKIAPFPYGIKEFGHKGPEGFNTYKRVFFQTLNITAVDKKTHIYAGYISKSQPYRQSIQSGPKLPAEEFFHNVAMARYILSPDGDRPDCFRHYEALGLGTVPITQLDAYLYRHLRNGPAIFNNSDWFVESLDLKLEPHPIVNRNLIFEDYWMSWCDHVAEINLTWNQNLTRDVNIEKAQDLFTSYLVAGDGIDDTYSSVI